MQSAALISGGREERRLPVKVRSVTDQQDRHITLSGHTRGGGAHHGGLEAPVSVAAHHDNVELAFLCKRRNFVTGVAHKADFLRGNAGFG